VGVQLQLDSRFEDYTVPWNRIREIVAGLNIHLFPAAPTKRHHLLMYKCVYTKKELKFSITLKKRKYSKGVRPPTHMPRPHTTNQPTNQPTNQQRACADPAPSSGGCMAGRTDGWWWLGNGEWWISMGTMANAQNPYIEFNLHEGEGWEFNEAVYKIRATFRRWKKSVFPPGSARNESSDRSAHARTHARTHTHKRAHHTPPHESRWAQGGSY
jgi:hypothetical protein